MHENCNIYYVHKKSCVAHINENKMYRQFFLMFNTFKPTDLFDMSFAILRVESVNVYDNKRYPL